MCKWKFFSLLRLVPNLIKSHHCLCFSKDRPVGREDLITLFEVFTTDSFSALVLGKNQGGQLYGYCQEHICVLSVVRNEVRRSQNENARSASNTFSALRGVNAVR